MSARPEVLALALVRHPDGDRLLVSHGGGFDRLLGGKVEHGELTHEAVARELREELDVDVSVETAPRQVLQSRFVYRDASQHQIVFVHDAVFVDTSLYGRSSFERIDRSESVGLWRSRAAPPPWPLYPDALDLS